MKTFIIYLLFFLGMFFVARAQVKIDNLEVSDKIAKEYFLDCYKNPDTVWFRSMNGGFSPDPQRDEYGRMAIKIITEDKMFSETMGIVTGYGYIVPRKPTSRDFMKWLSEKKGNPSW